MAPKISESSVLILYNRPGSCSMESERGVLEEVRAARDALKEIGVHYRVQGVADLAGLLGVLKGARETVVFNLVESLPGDCLLACLVPDICEGLGFGVTGSPGKALFKTTDKVLCKSMLCQAGILTPRWKVIKANSGVGVVEGLTYPLIIKPVSCDGSEGIYAEGSFIKAGAQPCTLFLEEQRGLYGCDIMAEEYVEGRELNVSVLESERGLEVLRVSEIDMSLLPDGMPRILDYHAKWDRQSYAYNNTPRLFPLDIRGTVLRKVEDAAVRCFELFGCRDYIRVDMRLGEDGNVWVIDVNTNPDISLDAGLAATLMASGITYPEFIRGVIRNALRRLRDKD